MIGIMDWGIGGLSVYQALRASGSSADVLYYSDSGSIPYGKLSREALRERLGGIAAFYAARGVSQVLVACHAASSALSSEPETGAEVLGEGIAFVSIIPAACQSVANSGARTVGVIGGNFTIQSGVYARALGGLGKELRLQSAQPLSAFVEAGELDSAGVEGAIGAILQALGPIDALLLACTHYPALTPVFRRLAPDLELLDPGAEMAPRVKERGGGRLAFHTSGDAAASARAARLAFGVELPASSAT